MGTRAPELEAAGGHFERHFHGKPVPEARRRHLGPRKEREVGAGVAFRIRIEEVIGARVVLVHGFLDETHAENAGVEIEVLLRGTGNRGDVMKPVDALHRARLARDAFRRA